MRRVNIYGSIPILIAACVLSCNVSEKKAPEVEKVPSLSSTDSLRRIIRAERLIHLVGCLECHSQRNWDIFGGPILEGTKGMGGTMFTKDFGGIEGTIYSRNITPAGIGDWTDEELTRAITQGITKTGDTLYPFMPYKYFNKMAADDISDIIFYLRSLKPVSNTVTERKLTVPIKQIYPKDLIQNINANVKPSEFDKIKYGEYLVNAAACTNCHTPSFAGGFKFKHEKFTDVSANITPDTTTGIGGWTEEVFLTKFKDYRALENYNYNPGRKNSMMPWLYFSQLDDYDLKSIYAYLRTVKPVTNKVEKFPE